MTKEQASTMESETQSIKSKTEEIDDHVDDLEKIIKDQVPLTETKSESDIGGDDSKDEDDCDDIVLLEEKKSKVSKRNKWIYGIGSILFLCALAGVIVGVVLDLNQRESTTNNLDMLEEDGNLVVNTQPTTSPTDGPSASPTVSFVPTSTPSDVPSLTPSASPTTSPSASPTVSSVPTSAPSDVPSLTPSASPTTSQAPTNTPTMSPTDFPTPEVVYWPQNPEPADPPSSYFNYDPDSDYGPHRWNRVNARNSWLKEFSSDGFGPWDGHLRYRSDVTGNKCGGPKRKQSPKDLTQTPRGRGGNAEGEQVCDATHEIRTACATHPLSDDEYFEKQILPHKLSIKNRRRSCLNVNEDGTGRGSCGGRKPPMVDFPKYAASGSDYADLQHTDFKIPGEHTLEGERFDAEIQLMHVHLTAPRVAGIAIPVRAKADGFNREFQYILNEFQKVWDDDKAKCEASKRNLRQQPQTSSWDEVEEPILYPNATSSRELQDNINRRHFNPYTDELMPGMFFYRYDGSITEPPCLDITWWVMDKPCVISFGQLNQLKKLLFGHVDENCKPTSVHNKDQEVVRPIQPLGEDRVVQHCPAGSFKSDESKGRKPGKRCRA